MSGTRVPSVAFITLGCPKNEVDSDRMRAAVASSRYLLAEDPDAADVVVVNTCSFIRDATEESVSVVLDLAAEHTGDLADRILVVAGCMPSRYGSELESAMPEIDAFLPVAEEGELLALLERLTGVPAQPAVAALRSRTCEGVSAYLQISDGCHRSCSYCTIPAIRGPYRSRALAEITAEAAELVALGAREIILIGQDITAYGRDVDSDDTLADVVDAVAGVPGVHWVRLMYLQPDGITDELLVAMAANSNVLHYLDMPLQHASGSVLRRMKRRGDTESYLALIERVRRSLPDAVLRTTLISGFPGESKSDSAELQNFVRTAGFDYVGVFPYSAEDGTVAATLDEQVPRRTKIARAQRLRDIADEIGSVRAASLVGEELEVLVEGIDPDDGVVFGRWWGQAPEIDGVVLLDGGNVGEIVRVRIVDSLGYDLEGEVI